MPTNIIPSDPLLTRPQKLAVQEEDDIIDIPEEAEPEEPKPDVTHIVAKINKRLAGTWASNELRCGRSYVVGTEFDPDEIREVLHLFASRNWEVKTSKDPKQGIVISLKPPPAAKEKSKNTRGTGGYL